LECWNSLYSGGLLAATAKITAEFLERGYCTLQRISGSDIDNCSVSVIMGLTVQRWRISGSDIDNCSVSVIKVLTVQRWRISGSDIDNCSVSSGTLGRDYGHYRDAYNDIKGGKRLIVRGYKKFCQRTGKEM
jgi:hypothetical protein